MSTEALAIRPRPSCGVDEWLTMREASATVKYSRASIYRLIKEEGFPKPHKAQRHGRGNVREARPRRLSMAARSGAVTPLDRPQDRRGSRAHSRGAADALGALAAGSALFDGLNDPIRSRW